MTLTVYDVFTPGDFPAHTYVERGEDRLEQRLRDALSTPGEVVSVSGPSKSGKTVLLERVAGRDNLITVTGAGIEKAEDVWDRVLDWMGTPSSISTGTEIGGEASVSATAKGSVGIPLVAKGEAGGTAGGKVSGSKARSETVARRGLVQVVEEIANSDFVVLIDDFHYMHRSVQTEVAKQIKEAVRQGVNICTASVPHRADDVVRSNPELRGRVRAIDLSYWTQAELRQIADLGFAKLRSEVSREAIAKFAIEASGSPQLMQIICLQACLELNVRQELIAKENHPLGEGAINRILEETATRADFSSIVRGMHTGPKTRGTERKEFGFQDATRGDVYRCVLLAVASDPPCLSFSYTGELTNRIQRVCKGSESPQAASIYQACSQIARMAHERYPDERIIEWDDQESLLEIIDPYFLFYLRWSARLRSLAESR